jgi:hypothetical protein
MNFVNKRGHTPVVDFNQLNENLVPHLDFGVEDVFTDRTKVTAKIRERKQGYKCSVDKATIPCVWKTVLRKSNGCKLFGGKRRLRFLDSHPTCSRCWIWPHGCEWQGNARRLLRVRRFPFNVELPKITKYEVTKRKIVKTQSTTAESMVDVNFDTVHTYPTKVDNNASTIKKWTYFLFIMQVCVRCVLCCSFKLGRKTNLTLKHSLVRVTFPGKIIVTQPTVNLMEVQTVGDNFGLNARLAARSLRMPGTSS